jgi:hypothetical protein
LCGRGVVHAAPPRVSAMERPTRKRTVANYGTLTREDGGDTTKKQAKGPTPKAPKGGAAGIKKGSAKAAAKVKAPPKGSKKTPAKSSARCVHAVQRARRPLPAPFLPSRSYPSLDRRPPFLTPCRSTPRSRSSRKRGYPEDEDDDAATEKDDGAVAESDDTAGVDSSTDAGAEPPTKAAK